mgnify:CR=1 FL=1
MIEKIKVKETIAVDYGQAKTYYKVITESGKFYKIFGWETKVALIEKLKAGENVEVETSSKTDEKFGEQHFIWGLAGEKKSGGKQFTPSVGWKVDLLQTAILLMHEVDAKNKNVEWTSENVISTAQRLKVFVDGK